MDLIIDPGHGGKDPGAVAGDRKEKDIALKISLYQYRRAAELGLKAGLTRFADTYLGLNDRAQLVEKSGARVCISNHVNAGGGNGAEVFHSVTHKPTFALYVIEALENAGSGRHGTGYKIKLSLKHPGKDFYRMHYTGKTETIIVEYGFIDNKTNLEALEKNLEAYAEAALFGVCRYLGKPYTLPKKEAKKMDEGLKNELIRSFGVALQRIAGEDAIDLQMKHIEKLFVLVRTNGRWEG